MEKRKTRDDEMCKSKSDRARERSCEFVRKFEGKVDQGSMRWLEREKIEDGRENACKSKKEMTKGERWLEKRDGKYPYENTIVDQNIC